MTRSRLSAQRVWARAWDNLAFLLVTRRKTDVVVRLQFLWDFGQRCTFGQAFCTVGRMGVVGWSEEQRTARNQDVLTSQGGCEPMPERHAVKTERSWLTFAICSSVPLPLATWIFCGGVSNNLGVTKNAICCNVEEVSNARMCWCRDQCRQLNFM